jgi:hypothetical protein
MVLLFTITCDDGYPNYESLKVGRRAEKYVVELPEAIWLPRAISWAQGLHAMQTLVFQLKDAQG